jgi:hypothetical protein
MKYVTWILMGLILGCGASWAWACCAVSGPGTVVVNADQTVLIIWNSKSKTQHFIRQAAFKSDANEVGFLVPSPTKPELAETDLAVFDTLKDITTPKVKSIGGGGGGFGGGGLGRNPNAVVVLEKKRVAGYDATVLKADSGESLVEWLKANKYDFSPAVATWAKPYIQQKWVFTALKVIPKEEQEAANAAKSELQTPGLRMSFNTETPLFPYREPKSNPLAQNFVAKTRTLQIFFIAEGEYGGTLTNPENWSGRKYWSNKLDAAQTQKIIMQLKLPADQFPAEPWLTEFRDRWAYDRAQSDLQFFSASQKHTI